MPVLGKHITRRFESIAILLRNAPSFEQISFHYVALAGIDLSAAFDVVDVELLKFAETKTFIWHKNMFGY